MTKTGAYKIGEKEYKRQWYRKQAMNRVDYNRFKKLGVTPEEYAQRVLDQDGKCAICQEKCPTGRRLSQDHCHETGKIRDLLCHSCNTSLGGFKDSVDMLQKAIDYLERHSGD